MNDTFYFKGLVLSSRTHRCLLHGKELVLTDTEFSILEMLMKHRGQPVSMDALAKWIWPNEATVECENTICVHVHNIRKKLNDNHKPFQFIKTVRGTGYVIR